MIRRTMLSTVGILLMVGSMQLGSHLWMRMPPPDRNDYYVPPTFHCVKVLNPLGLYVDVCRETGQ